MSKLIPSVPGVSFVSPRVEFADPAESFRPRATLRVLHLINGEHYAGAERVQDNLALQLPAEGVETAFACVKPRAFADKRRSQDTPLYELPMRSRIDVRPAFRLARLIEREGFDLIHTHTPRTAMIGSLAARRTGVPFVHHVHGQTATEVNAGWKQRLTTMIENRSIRRADVIIAVSETARRYMTSHGFADDQVAVVPNGIAAPRILPNRKPPAANDAWTLGIVGLLRPRKGLEVLLRAIAQLRQAGRDVRMRAVGPFETEDYGHEVRTFAEELGIEEHICWRGFQRDIAAELAEIDLFAFPSILPEGMPMVVLEAMAHGVPIVASSVPGVVDCLENDAEALLVLPNSADDLSRAVDRIITGEVDGNALRHQARERQQREFSMEATAASIARIYRRIVGQ